MNDRYFLSIPAAILSLGLILSTFVGGSYMYRVQSFGQSVAVTGSAQKILTSDVVKWQVMISKITGLTGSKQGSDQISLDLASLKKHLAKSGITDDQITITPLVVETLTSSYETGSKPEGYKLLQTVIVESRDVAGVTKLAQGAGNLLGGESLITTISLEYFYSKLSDLKVDMLAEATKNAHERAKKIAESAGSILGPLQSADMGVMQVTAVNSTDVSDYGSYDTSSIQKQITAIVRATFAVR